MIAKHSYFFLITVVIILVACKEPGEKYYLKDKWKTKALSYSVLKNKPKSVVEYIYHGIENIEQKSLPLHGSYELFNFNDEGDLSEYKLYISKDQFYNFSFEYSENGWNQMQQDKTTVGFQKKIFLSVERKKEYFLQTLWLTNGDKKETIIKYLDNGDKILEEQYLVDDSLNMKTFITSVYKGQLIISKEIKTEDEKYRIISTELFYYNQDKFIDSIVSTTGRNKTKTFFVNNDYGDQIREIEIKNGDTIKNLERKFMYDKHANWVRMLEKDLIKYPFPSQPSPYVLIDRVIQY